MIRVPVAVAHVGCDLLVESVAALAVEGEDQGVLLVLIVVLGDVEQIGASPSAAFHAKTLSILEAWFQARVFSTAIRGSKHGAGGLSAGCRRSGLGS